MYYSSLKNVTITLLDHGTRRILRVTSLLVGEGLAQKDTLYRYAVGTLALWFPKDVPLDPEEWRGW